MESLRESKRANALIAQLNPISQQVNVVFPELGWDLKRAGYTIDAVMYLSTAIFVALMVFVFGIFVITIPLSIKGNLDVLVGVLVSVVLSLFSLLYVLLLPKLKISKIERQTNKHLEYMLKDMEVQLTAGIPLFDTFVNIAGGNYGECSNICNKIVREVQSGKSIINVLDEFGLLSSSEYLRRVFWQIVNALKTGSNITIALKAISDDIRVEKENSIRAYAQELGLWSLVYMIFIIVLPSMGVTLLLILSSFVGGSVIEEFHFWGILLGIMFFQFVFISIIKSKRPDVG